MTADNKRKLFAICKENTLSIPDFQIAEFVDINENGYLKFTTPAGIVGYLSPDRWSEAEQKPLHIIQKMANELDLARL